MRRSDNRTVLTDEVARFQTEVRRLALAVVSEILKQELDRKRAKLPAARKPAKPPAARKRAKLPTARQRAKPPAPPDTAAPPPEQLSLDLDAPAPKAPREQPPDPPPPPPPPPAGGKKRVPWTRETIVSELATWMLSGTAIDATFVARHGPPGLVAATRRVFGRFEAALNVAALHISKLYPDGPPERGPA